MTHALNAQECLERARMHEQLAATTADASARMMHQAMAAEFRRRAAMGGMDMTRQVVNKPIIELCPPVA
ncbi:hypothetical protein BV98_001180 [Sphingobium herbicidovorans NBRC 16415]|jgi:hypothetical protein|uniref:Uncharacterized protein n=1 Tax=Sphingobium herbicidovorans (strain ATCC 700291 / DSM 11019 / CCUG 56400 / KCTC 2939 / LMG 18315 / NBRC 16415 / MH) TaxID=1219045 RepID=A0A086PC69_SPHHM|nr:hypothetical protein [Sphingobium herbicidovorans]KFG90987.1 hypothetical protein BV98_001180 [Sphingobium herbicidovorans NBRC 16415]